jgi:hypothetical protein
MNRAVLLFIVIAYAVSWTIAEVYAAAEYPGT